MAPVRCLNCGIEVLRLRRHAIDDIGLNRHRNILREWIPDVVFDQNVLCHECFLILDAIPENSPGYPDRSFGHANTCLGCGLSLNGRRNLPVHENINEIIRAWPDVPRVDFSNLTCRTCCEIMRRRQVNVTCLGCGMGLTNYYGDEIALQERGVSKHSQNQSIVNDTVSPDSCGESPASGEGGRGRGGEGACAACGGGVGTHGRRARGSPAEQLTEAAISPQVDFSNLTCRTCCEIMRGRLVNVTCLGCGMGLANYYGDEISLQEREMNEETLLCNDCYKNGKGMHQNLNRIVLSENFANATVSTLPTSNVSAAPEQTITLPNYKRVPDRTDGCLFPNCPVKSFYIIPQYVKQCLLRDYKLYTPEHSRVCKEHLISRNWKSVFEIAQSDFTAQQIEDVISILATNMTRLNFDNIEEVPRNLLLYCTGIDHRQFKNILDKIPSLMRKTKHPVLALIAYLTVLRTNYCFDRLSTLFDIKPPILEELTDIVKKCMLTEFVPRHARATLSSAKTKKVSEVLLEDEHILRYLEEHYYADGAMHSRVETVVTSEPNQCRKRKNSSDSDEDLLESKAGPKKPLIEEILETNESIEISEVDVEFERPEGVEARVVSERDEEPEKPRVKEESDDEGEAAEDGETGDRHLVYVPKPTEQLQTDPLDTIVVPAPLLEPVKSEEDPVTDKEEPEGRDSETQSTASTSHPSRPFSVYYMKGASNFIRDPGPKFVLELPR